MMTDEFNRLANNAIHALDELFDHLHAVQADDGKTSANAKGSSNTTLTGFKTNATGWRKSRHRSRKSDDYTQGR